MPLQATPESAAECDILGERDFATSLIPARSELVLDLGTGGSACTAIVLACRGFRVVAVDRDHRAVALARRKLAETGLLGQVVVVQADAAHLPFRAGSIRRVVSYSALHHASDLRGVLAGIASVLHVRGSLVVSDWDEAGNGFLGRLVQALRARFGNVRVIPRPGRSVYVCKEPRRSSRRVPIESTGPAELAAEDGRTMRTGTGRL